MTSVSERQRRTSTRAAFASGTRGSADVSRTTRRNEHHRHRPRLRPARRDLGASGGSPPCPRVYELAIEILEARRPTRYLVKAYRQLARVLKDMGDRDAAFDVLEKAVGVQDRVGRFLI